MRVLLDGLLPRLFPGLAFLCVPHEGKNDLENSLIDTLRNWRVPGDRFVIVRDNDQADCISLKERLRGLCREGRRSDASIRIVCQELEAWYLGDPDALAKAFGDEGLRRLKRQPQYRNPDSRPKPSRDLERLVPGFRKIAGARAMAGQLRRKGNRSHSYAVFLDRVDDLWLRT